MVYLRRCWMHLQLATADNVRTGRVTVCCHPYLYLLHFGVTNTRRYIFASLIMSSKFSNSIVLILLLMSTTLWWRSVFFKMHWFVAIQYWDREWSSNFSHWASLLCDVKLASWKQFAFFLCYLIILGLHSFRKLSDACCCSWLYCSTTNWWTIHFWYFCF